MKENKFEYETTIKEQHLDTFGHVNNAVYLTLLEEARWEIIAPRGYGLETIRKTQIGPTILEINIKYKKEIKNRDKIKIVSHPENPLKKISKITQLIYNQDDELCCEAVLTIGLFDLKKRALIPPTKEWVEALGGKFIQYSNDVKP